MVWALSNGTYSRPDIRSAGVDALSLAVGGEVGTVGQRYSRKGNPPPEGIPHDVLTRSVADHSRKTCAMKFPVTGGYPDTPSRTAGTSPDHPCPIPRGDNWVRHARNVPLDDSRPEPIISSDQLSSPPESDHHSDHLRVDSRRTCADPQELNMGPDQELRTSTNVDGPRLQVWKSCVGQPTEGSNPTLSAQAMLNRGDLSQLVGLRGT